MSACWTAAGFLGSYALGISVLGAFGVAPALSPLLSGLASGLGLTWLAGRRARVAGPSPALLRAVDRVSRDMEGMRDPGQLANLVVAALNRALKPSRLYLWLPSRERASFYLAAGLGPFPQANELPEEWIQDFFDYLSSDVLNPVDLPPNGSTFSRWLASKRLSLCLPIVSHGRLIGLLTCGEKADGRAYNGSDRWLLNQMLRQAALALSYMGLMHERRQAKNEVHNLVNLYRDAQQRAITDGLTGLMTHLFFQEQLAQRFHEARRYQAPLTVMLIDVDHFKQFNDRYGHQAGDEVLRQVARAVREQARSCDTVARYGGEELAMVLPQTDLEGALILAERIRAAIEALEVSDPMGRRLPVVTASIGLAALALHDGSPAEMIERADRGLYAAKRAGRNQVSLDPSDYGQAWAG